MPRLRTDKFDKLFAPAEKPVPAEKEPEATAATPEPQPEQPASEPAAPPVDDRPVGEIVTLASVAPPEEPRAFQMLDANDPRIAEFVPPPTIAPSPSPTPSVQLGLPPLPAPREQGMTSTPPVVVETRTPPPPPPPEWDRLPERTRVEMQVGRRKSGGIAPLEQAMHVVPATPLPRLASPEAPPAAAVDWGSLPAKTRAELEYGRRKQADREAYRQSVLVQQAGVASERLAQGGRPTGDELDYPQR